MPYLKTEIWPFGHNCNPLQGEVSEETKTYLIESEKAKEEDFEVSEETKEKKKNK